MLIPPAYEPLATGTCCCVFVCECVSECVCVCVRVCVCVCVCVCFSGRKESTQVSIEQLQPYRPIQNRYKTGKTRWWYYCRWAIQPLCRKEMDGLIWRFMEPKVELINFFQWTRLSWTTFITYLYRVRYWIYDHRNGIDSVSKFPSLLIKMIIPYEQFMRELDWSQNKRCCRSYLCSYFMWI